VKPELKNDFLNMTFSLWGAIYFVLGLRVATFEVSVETCLLLGKFLTISDLPHPKLKKFSWHFYIKNSRYFVCAVKAA
jgi:hypothetical protein